MRNMNADHTMILVIVPSKGVHLTLPEMPRDKTFSLRVGIIILFENT